MFWIVAVFFVSPIDYFVLLLFVFVYYIFVEGFGLFISKGIVDLHKGEIRVISKGEGTGCTFTVDLPMIRKIEPIVAVNHMRRLSTRERIVGMLSGKNGHRRPCPSSHLNQRVTSPLDIDDSVPLPDRTSGARIDLILPNQDEVRSGGSVMSIGRQSLRDLAEHDRTVRSAARQSTKGTALLHNQTTDRYSFPTRNPERRDASGGGPTMSPPSLRGKHTRDDAAVAVGSDHAVDPPSQQLQPAATTMVTSSPSPAPLSVPAPAPAPLSSSAASSPKSPKQSHNEQRPPQGPVYRILVVDDSSMTRKMLLKTLRNEGLVHPLNTLDTSSHLPNTLNLPSLLKTPSQCTF